VIVESNHGILRFDFVGILDSGHKHLFLLDALDFLLLFFEEQISRVEARFFLKNKGLNSAIRPQSLRAIKA
jgi:hypothetical protein